MMLKKLRQTSVSKVSCAKHPFYGKSIYLDYAATTPIDPRVLKTMLPYLKKEFGNASSVHGLGQKAKAAIEESRRKAANFLNCGAEEIFFTGSATEADNLAVKGVIDNLAAKIGTCHIITAQIEHDAVLEPCRALEKQGADYKKIKFDQRHNLLKPKAATPKAK